MQFQDQYAYFTGLHAKGRPLVLPNAWDVGSALALERANAKAVATSSWAIASANGFEDGEAYPIEKLKDIARHIARSVRVPVSVDFESGYAQRPDQLSENAHMILQADIIGLNFEDGIVGGKRLYSVEDQVGRIGAILSAATAIGRPLFLNARTDLFLNSDPSVHRGLVGEAITRAQAYAAAGAAGFFVPGTTDAAILRSLADACLLPINAMVGPNDKIEELTTAGVSRFSFGPAIYLNAMRQVQQLAGRLLKPLGTTSDGQAA